MLQWYNHFRQFQPKYEFLMYFIFLNSVSLIEIEVQVHRTVKWDVHPAPRAVRLRRAAARRLMWSRG